MSGTHATLTIVADDLTGAADAAGGYGSARTSAVVLGPDVPWPAADVLAVDTESRYLPEQEAADLVGSVVRRSVALGRPVFKKIDSLLRGNVGAELAAALTAISGAERGLAVVAPRLPRHRPHDRRRGRPRGRRPEHGRRPRRRRRRLARRRGPPGREAHPRSGGQPRGPRRSPRPSSHRRR
ncbi:four-carbon acid sugar kinase family protein [Curtobacterium sp. MCJR17_043]|nr:four-carbon acid sugar kinase family protein [Curtobacterium sp. MCJR17_043]WIB37142.1 four-carbon acid sugar kinase family protein [Curtobacterium sp. MCJR17_043]